jgi:hypothetical protein
MSATVSSHDAAGFQENVHAKNRDEAGAGLAAFRLQDSPMKQGVR